MKDSGVNTEDIIADEELADSFSVTHFVVNSNETSVLCRAQYHRVILIESGEGNFIIDDVSYTISTKQILLVRKGQVFGWKEASSIHGVEIAFGDCFWERTPASASNCKAVLFDTQSSMQHLPLDTITFEHIVPFFRNLLQEFNSPGYVNKPDALAAFLKIIMIKVANLQSEINERLNSYDKQLYLSFIELLEKHYYQKKEVAEYAQLLEVSARKLTDACKQYGGAGAKELINQHIITESKRLLQFTTTPVKEIAYTLNFPAAEQFSHFFKKYAGVSPHTFRTNFTQIRM